MSMTISAANYLSSTQQNTQTTLEKAGQKSDTAEVGKTQRSTVSASLDQVNMGEDGVAITQVSRLQGAEQTNPQKASNPPRMDTVEISEEGKAASAKLQGQQTSSASTAGVSQYETDEEDEDDLSQYTDAQLKQMYYSGEITRQEYEKQTGETLE